MAKKQLKRIQKKLGNKLTILCLVFIFIGLVVGAGTVYFITKNDKFEFIGSSEITLNVGDTYTEQGVKVVAFGKDISNEVIVEGEINTNKKGVYILTYKVKNIRFTGYTLYKKITVNEVVE